MNDYHFVWLKARPYRSEEWLKRHLEDGFEIHHIDGDHFNNELSNLVLIERTDHAAIHGHGNFITPLPRYKSTKNYKRCYGYAIGPFSKWAFHRRIPSYYIAENYEKNMEIRKQRALAATCIHRRME